MSTSPSILDSKNLRLATRKPIIDALSNFVGKPVNTWLPTGHQTVTGQFLKSDGKPYSSYTAFEKSFTHQEILDVLAATGPSHCFDGWTFLSRALAALLMGDTHTTRHLAYYAQLRAALSLLHCHGIGIFNRLNFAVDASGKPHHIRTINPKRSEPGTHVAAWDALQIWADQIDTATEFLESIKFRDVPLQNCINSIWPSATVRPLVSRVIKYWGIDLKRSAIEQESRNISSYCAHTFNKVDSEISSRLELVQSIWRGLEPDGSGGFPLLDRHLLRELLEFMDNEQFKITSRNINWESAFQKIDPKVKSFVSKEFIKRNEEPDDLTVFIHARDAQPGNVHAMICRALLLLRLATAVVRSAFIDANFDLAAKQLQPWFETVGVDRGFWSVNKPTEELEDLWYEVSYAVDDLEKLASTPPNDQYELISSLTDQPIFLSQAERACIWGVGV